MAMFQYELRHMLILALVTLLAIATTACAGTGGKRGHSQAHVIAVSSDAPDDDLHGFMPARPFGQVVSENFSLWANGTGVIDKERMGELLGDPSIKGDSAAALAALAHGMFNKKHGLPESMTRQELSILDQSTPSLEHQYRHAAFRLSHINRSIFATGRPRFEMMKQGPSGNCYFFAPLGWMVKFRPDDIVTAIRRTNGGYLVRFPRGNEATVTEPTDAELVGFHSARTLDDGLWVAVLEKALGELQAETSARKAEIPNPILRIAFGGHGVQLIRLWSGNEIDNVPLANTSATDIREALKDMKAERLLTLTGTPKDVTGKLPGNHVFAVFGYRPELDKVVVWNPWGNDFEPKGEEGIENGYITKHGIFQMPLEEFVQVFSKLHIGRD